MRWWIGIGIGLLVVFSALFLGAEAIGIADPGVFSRHLLALRDRPAGLWAVGAAIALLLAGDLILPVPSSILMTLSGFFLGTAVGALVTFAGAMGSALLGFGLCRRFGQPAFRRLVSEHDTTHIAAFLDRYGAWAILLSRSVPMLTEVMSCLAGLSTLSFRKFAALSAAGTLPLCAVYAWAGARSQETPTGIGWALLLAFVIPGIGFACVRHLRRPPS